MQGSVLTFPSRIVSFRGFGQMAPRKQSKITAVEFKAAVDGLKPDFGNVQ